SSRGCRPTSETIRRDCRRWTQRSCSLPSQVPEDVHGDRVGSDDRVVEFEVASPGIPVEVVRKFFWRILRDEADLLGESLGVVPEAAPRAAEALFEVGNRRQVSGAFCDVTAGGHPSAQGLALVFGDSEEDTRPLCGFRRARLARGGDVLVVHDPQLFASAAHTMSAAVDVGEGDFVGGLGVEPFADEASVVVAGEAADPGSGRGVGVRSGGHGGSPPWLRRAAGATGSRAQGIDALTPPRRSQEGSRPRPAGLPNQVAYLQSTTTDSVLNPLRPRGCGRSVLVAGG